MSVPVLALGRMWRMWRRIIYKVRVQVLRTSSLPARNGLGGGGSIFRGCWCVMSTYLCLPQLRERFRNRCSAGTTRLGSVAALNIQRLVHRSFDVAWDVITHALSSFSVTPQRRRPSSYKRPTMTSSQSSRANLRQLQVMDPIITLDTAHTDDVDSSRQTRHRHHHGTNQKWSRYNPSYPTARS